MKRLVRRISRSVDRLLQHQTGSWFRLLTEPLTRARLRLRHLAISGFFSGSLSEEVSAPTESRASTGGRAGASSKSKGPVAPGRRKRLKSMIKRRTGTTKSSDADDSAAVSSKAVSSDARDSTEARLDENHGANNNHSIKENGFQRKSRRTNSVDRANEIAGKEKKERQEQPDRPCHTPQDSLFSSSSGYTNYRGILNLCIILLVVSNARMALENILKYGILVEPFALSRVVMDPTFLPCIQIFVGLWIMAFVSMGIEKILATGYLSESIAKAMITLHTGAVVVVPAYVVYAGECHVAGSVAVLSFASVTFLKLISYHMVNFWCRMESPGISRRPSRLRRYRSFTKIPTGPDTSLRALSRTFMKYEDETPALVQYPDNLHARDLIYFMLVPTLCYELNFPRSQRIRKRFVIRRAIEVVFLSQVMLSLVQQWLFPTIVNSVGPLKQMNYPKMFERLLKLAIPNHIIWLIGFYWLFHSCLNLWAEILRFADREFYRDWWNSCSVQYFWANWNIPVHKWCLRHLYKPLLSYGVTRGHASIMVFFVSAFFHEYLVSVPLKMFRIWAFSGMVFQIPFAYVVALFSDHPQWANALVWLSLIIGQPLCILMYYHDFIVNLVSGGVL